VPGYYVLFNVGEVFMNFLLFRINLGIVTYICIFDANNIIKALQGSFQFLISFHFLIS